MSQIYTTRRRAVGEAGKAAASARGTRQGAYFGRGTCETGEGMGSQLGELMQARMRQHFLDHQNPVAEREADRLSAGLDSARTPEEVKSRLGERLGADFSGVRFHTDAGAASTAQNMGARAFASGRDIYFGAGGFDPSVAAHELVHTVQQGLVDSSASTVSAPAGEIQMWPWDKKKKMEISAPSDVRVMTPQEVQAGRWKPEEAEQERQRIAESNKGLKEKLGDKISGFFSSHFSNEKTQAAAAAYENYNAADDIAQKLAGNQYGKMRTTLTKAGAHAKKFGLGVQKHFMGAGNAAVNQEGGIKDRIGAAGLYAVNEARDYLGNTQLGKTFRNKGILGTAKHYGGKALNAIQNSSAVQAIHKYGGRVVDSVRNSSAYQKSVDLVHRFGETKAGKWLGDKASSAGQWLKEKAVSAKNAAIGKYASYKRRHEDAVADIASEESKAKIQQMSPFQKLMLMVKNAPAYLDAHTKAGKNRAMKKREGDQQVKSLAERMRKMASEDMVVTTPDDAADMQDLFREEEELPVQQEPEAGSSDESFGRDMREMFGEEDTAARGAEEDVDENFGSDMRELFDPERMAREDREQSSLSYEGKGEDSALGEKAVDIAIKLGDAATGKAVSTAISVKDRIKNFFSGGYQFLKNKIKGGKIRKEMDTEQDQDVKKVMGYASNTRDVRARRGLEKMLGPVISSLTGSDKAEELAEPALAASDGGSLSLQKQARMALIDPRYQQYYEYALSELVHPDKYKKMDREQQDQVEHQAKHAALQALYGDGVTTRQEAAALEADRKVRATNELVSSNPEAKKKLLDTVGFREDEEKGGFQEQSALKKFSADFNGETFQEKRQELFNRKYRKKNVTDAYIQDSSAEGDGFFKTLFKTVKKKLF